MKDILGFSRTRHMRRVMSVNGFMASIMRTEKKKEGSSKDLPPGLPIPVLPVDYLNVRPDDWIGGAGSFVVPVQPEWALWFNWSMNNTEETSVLASVKGMNPLTGQSFEDFKLEKFRDTCPEHGCGLLEGNLCPECGFKWPNQNFYSKPNPLYCDGFLQPNGEVKQFYFTEDMKKSIPDLVLGEDKTVPAFGFCFYKVKDAKKDYERCTRHKEKFPEKDRFNGYYGGSITPRSTIEPYVYPFDGLSDSRTTLIYSKSCSSVDPVYLSETSSMLGTADALGVDEVNMFCASTADTAFTDEFPTVDVMYAPSFPGAVLKNVGIGAGASIEQEFGESWTDVDDYNEEPSAVIRLYFVFQEEFDSYVAHGLKDLSGSPEGYLKDLPMGGSDE